VLSKTLKTDCPHCGRPSVLVDINPNRSFLAYARASSASIDSPDFNPNQRRVVDGEEMSFDIDTYRCQGCERVVIYQTFEDDSQVILFPAVSNRGTNLAAVDPDLASEYLEAVRVSHLSPKSAAALLRLCLQHLLIKNGATSKFLNQQIADLEQEFPSHVQGLVDKIRELGNFAVHPFVTENSSVIVEVENHEVDLMFYVIEELFDHYYTKKARMQTIASDIEQKASTASHL